MPATYHAFRPAVWDRKFRQLSRDAKITALYVMTCPHKTTEGLYPLPLHYIAGDTGLGESEVSEALNELTLTGYLEYDADTETVLDLNALRFTPLKKPDKRIPGAVRQLRQVAHSPLLKRFELLAAEFSPDLRDEMLQDDTLYKPLTSPSGAPSKGRVETEQLRGESESEVPGSVPVRSPSEAVAFLKDKLGAEEVGHG